MVASQALPRFIIILSAANPNRHCSFCGVGHATTEVEYRRQHGNRWWNHGAFCDKCIDSTLGGLNASVTDEYFKRTGCGRCSSCGLPSTLGTLYGQSALICRGCAKRHVVTAIEIYHVNSRDTCSECGKENGLLQDTHVCRNCFTNKMASLKLRN